MFAQFLKGVQFSQYLLLVFVLLPQAHILTCFVRLGNRRPLITLAQCLEQNFGLLVSREQFKHFIEPTIPHQS